MLLETPANARLLSKYCEYRRLARRIVLLPTSTAPRRKVAEDLVQLHVDGWLRPQHRDRPVEYRVAEAVKAFGSGRSTLEMLVAFRYRDARNACRTIVPIVAATIETIVRHSTPKIYFGQSTSRLLKSNPKR